MNDKRKNQGKGRPGGKPDVRNQHQKSTSTGSAANVTKEQAKEHANRTVSDTKARASESRTTSSASIHSRSDNNTKSSGGWLAPVALLFGVLGTLMSAILWSKLGTLSDTTTRAMADQRSETSSKIADSQTQITASMEEKFAANQEQMTTAFTEQQAAVDGSLEAMNDKVSTSLTSFNEELRTTAQADKEEISSATAMSIQEFSSSSENELNSISTSFNVGIRTVREDFEKRLEENESKVAMMQESVQSINASAVGDQSDWILAEVEYLLRTGQHKVTLAGDVDAGVTALESANNRLDTLGDVDFFPVREQIDVEVAELKSAGSPDIEGLASRLESASDVAEGLPLKAAEEEAEVAEGEENAAEGQAEESSAVGGLLKNLNFSVSNSTQEEVDAKIRASQAKAKAQASAAASSVGEGGQSNAQISVGEIVSTHLQAARLSALRADSEQFMTHMDSALELSGEAFDTDDSAVGDFVADLEQIRETNIVPNVPTLGSALSLFEQINAKRSEK